MNLSKVGPSLCLAFQISEGPFHIIHTFDGGEESFLASKSEIDILSEQEFVQNIEIVFCEITSKGDKRWRKRVF